LIIFAAMGGIAIRAHAGSSTVLITGRRWFLHCYLGTYLVVHGAAKGFAASKRSTPLTWLGVLAALPGEGWRIVPWGVWLTAFLALLVAGMLIYTRLGRHIFALGSNEQTARLCGVNVDRVKVIVYSLGGAFAGVAGVFQFSRLTVGDPTVAMGVELDVIAAVVIGGGSLSGGEGSILGSIVGALIMTVIRSGCAQMGLPNWVQEMVTGCIIVLAVAIDRWQQRRRT
jgi:ribose/xylose/arabinose/galactoside ABC-type transport system permease subunit